MTEPSNATMAELPDVAREYIEALEAENAELKKRVDLLFVANQSHAKNILDHIDLIHKISDELTSLRAQIAEREIKWCGGDCPIQKGEYWICDSEGNVFKAWFLICGWFDDAKGDYPIPVDVACWAEIIYPEPWGGK